MGYQVDAPVKVCSIQVGEHETNGTLDGFETPTAYHGILEMLGHWDLVGPRFQSVLSD